VGAVPNRSEVEGRAGPGAEGWRGPLEPSLAGGLWQAAVFDLPFRIHFAFALPEKEDLPW
jgi:hypothetical protein